jgi:transcriptional regulator with XRE-family HTH domain
MSFFGKNIKFLRTTNRLSQTAFAEIFNLNRAVIGAYEEERAEPKVEIFVKVAQYFSVDLNDLICKDLSVKPSVSDKKTYNYGIPIISEQNINEYRNSLKNNTLFTAQDFISIPKTNPNDFVAIELGSNFLISKLLKETEMINKNCIILSENGFLFPPQIMTDTVIIQKFEIIFVLKKYDSTDYNELLMKQIFEKLDSIEKK